MANVRATVQLTVACCLIHCLIPDSSSSAILNIEVEENRDLLLKFPLYCLRPDVDHLIHFYNRHSSIKRFIKASTTVNNETGQVDIRLDINDTTSFRIGSQYTCGIQNASSDQDLLVSANFIVQSHDQVTDAAPELKCLQMTSWLGSPTAIRRGDPVCCSYSCLAGVKVWKQSSALGRIEFIYPGRDGVINLDFSVDTTVSGTLLLTIFNVSGVGQSVTYGLERDGQRLGFGYNVSVIKRKPRSDYTSTTTTANLSTATHSENNTQQNSTYPSTHGPLSSSTDTVFKIAFPSVASVAFITIVSLACVYLFIISPKQRLRDLNIAGIKSETVSLNPNQTNRK